MKWTMYSDAGVRMCDPQAPSPVLGSLGHEAADADFFKTLNTEYVNTTTAMPMDLQLARTPPKTPGPILSLALASCGKNFNESASLDC